MRTSIEGARGCGYRKPGGLYLVSDRVGLDCLLLPFVLDVCPCCGAGIKPARGWTWVDPDALLPHHIETVDGVPDANTEAQVHPGCPLNKPGLLGERAGLLWIGESFYPTPAHWLKEGRSMGFSRRINAVPRGFDIGTTWVLVAHRKAHYRITPEGQEFQPAIFHIWKPERIEYVVRGDESVEELELKEARGIELVEVLRANEQLTT